MTNQSQCIALCVDVDTKLFGQASAAGARALLAPARRNDETSSRREDGGLPVIRDLHCTACGTRAGWWVWRGDRTRRCWR